MSNQPKTPENVREVALYAWVGEDELGSGEVGLKQHLMPCGITPLVAVKREKMDRDEVVIAMTGQSAVYGKTIRLCKFVFQEVIATIDAPPLKLHWNVIVGEVYVAPLMDMTCEEAQAEVLRLYPDRQDVRMAVNPESPALKALRRR